MWLRRLIPALVALTLMATVVLVFMALFGAQDPDGESKALTAKTNAEFYVVRDGDSLTGIEQKTGIEQDRLEQLNPKLDPLALLPGARIRLRPPNARERAARHARARARGPTRDTYVLKEGDILSEVAKENDVDLSEVLDLNPKIRHPDKVVPGQRIRLR